jgi:hypothetical protein
VPLVARLLITALAALALAPPAGAAECLGDLSAAGVPKLPGPRLRLGINPSGVAGALGPAVPAVPDRPEKTLAALQQLQPAGGAPLALRLNRLFWSGGEPLVRDFATRTHRYTSRGYLVELQVRYHPTKAQGGDIAGFVRFVRHVVRRFGADPRVVAMQVTNEANLTISPDSSDGAYKGVRDALIQGVIAAKDEARRDHYGQLTVGFNWVYRSDPSTDKSFWTELGAKGGPRFRQSLDWVGLDAYPGTFFPPTEPPGGERDGLVNAMSVLRKCFMPTASLGPSVPIHVEETGWPTGPNRSEARQLAVTNELLRTLDDFRGTYNVTDARWFDLRDHNTSSANFQHHYGLLRDDYSAKPAFGAFRQLVAQLAARPPHAPRVRIAVRTSVARAARLLHVPLGLGGGDAANVARVDWIAGHRVLARRTSAPFAVSVRRARHRRLLVRAVAVLRDGRVVPLRRVLRARVR